MFELSLTLLDAELQWLDRFIERQSQESADGKETS
jgi:hypothetical protein